MREEREGKRERGMIEKSAKTKDLFMILVREKKFKTLIFSTPRCFSCFFIQNFLSKRTFSQFLIVINFYLFFDKILQLSISTSGDLHLDTVFISISFNVAFCFIFYTPLVFDCFCTEIILFYS